MKASVRFLTLINVGACERPCPTVPAAPDPVYLIIENPLVVLRDETLLWEKAKEKRKNITFSKHTYFWKIIWVECLRISYQIKE